FFNPAHCRLYPVHHPGGDCRLVAGRPAAPIDAMATQTTHMTPGSASQRLLAVIVCVLLAGVIVTAARYTGVPTLLLDWFTDPAHWHGPNGIPVRLIQHLGYVFWSMLAGMAIALPLGIGLGHVGRGGLLAINVSNIGRAIPSFGLIILVFMLAGF